MRWENFAFKKQPGVNILELAVVVAIITVLAAVGFSRVNNREIEEQRRAEELAYILTTGLSQYMGHTLKQPYGIEAFVTTNNSLNGALPNVTVAAGEYAQGCVINPSGNNGSLSQLVCTAAFPTATTIEYNYNGVTGSLTTNFVW